jgi:prepilin-type N-terminal cleavage/methylation domain-containing protein
MNKNKGFTLIELLVVIAIIGILSSVVLASLSNARDKGKDAAVKSQLASMKAQAELYYSKTESYDGLCSAVQTADGFGGVTVAGLLPAAHASSGSAVGAQLIDITSNANGVTTVCNDSTDGWAVIVPLSASTTGSPMMYCADNTGLSRDTSTLLGINDYVCN